jgi:hypothetical protein
MEEIKQPKVDTQDKNKKMVTQNHPYPIKGLLSKEQQHPIAPDLHIEDLDDNF